jgi:hypothetical protein
MGIKLTSFLVQDSLTEVESGLAVIGPWPTTRGVTPARGGTGSERHGGLRSVSSGAAVHASRSIGARPGVGR